MHLDFAPISDAEPVVWAAPADPQQSGQPSTSSDGVSSNACWTISPLHRFDDAPGCRPGASRVALGLKRLEAGGIEASFGGEIRLRVDSFDAPSLGLRGQGEETVLQTRLLTHGDFHLDETMRVFVQLGWHDAEGRDPRPLSVDQSNVDLQQGFVEFRSDLGGGTATLRLGRQEMAYGLQRLVSVREGPNIRQSFDGGRLTWVRDGSMRLDVFATRVVTPRLGAFDDSPDTDQDFYGVHTTFRRAGDNLDVYYLGYARSSGSFTDSRGQEQRHTGGARWYGRHNGWDWDVEPIVQWGEMGGKTIAAWSVASILGHTFETDRLTPRLHVSMNAASGDRTRGDGRLETFNALFPRGPYFTEASLLAPMNFRNVDFGLEVKPKPNLSLSGKVDAHWRISTNDGVYLIPGILLTTPQSRSRFVGWQMQLRALWQPGPNLSVLGAIAYFDPSDALATTAARDQTYGGLTVSFRY